MLKAPILGMNPTTPQWHAGLRMEPPLSVFSPQMSVGDAIEALRPGVRSSFVTYVYVVDSASTASLRMVSVERTANGLSVIASGLSEGERVVSDGQSRLTPGAPVDLRSAKDSAGGGGGPGRGGRGGGRGGRGRGGKAPAP